MFVILARLNLNTYHFMRALRLFFFLTLNYLCFMGLSATPFNPPDNGRFKSVYENGKTKEEGYFRNGKKDKRWFYYDENGTVNLKERWKKGNLIWQVYYKKGKVVKTVDRFGKISIKPGCGS